jgi:hypothetical protein
MDLDILELGEFLGEFLFEFAPQIVANAFRKCEPIPPEMSSKNGIQTLFGPDGWWDEWSD